MILTTDRLILRTWLESDSQPMFEINQDPKVMAYFPRLQSLETTQKFITHVCHHFELYGYTLYACTRKDSNEFIGFIGLQNVSFQEHFTPAVEIGWRLSSKHWGQGFATEGAQAVLDDAFQRLKLAEVVSFTAIKNTRSIRVMQKIGLQHPVEDNFNHPQLDEKSPLKQHVLYRLSKTVYDATLSSLSEKR